MTVTLRKGRYLARMADGPADIAAAQALRHLCFIERAGLPARPGGLDRDGFDARCEHMLIEDALTGALAGCCRVLALSGGAEIGQSYSAQSYDLTRLGSFPGAMIELGRFCVNPAASNADVLRVAWGALAQLVDARGVQMLFGCSSFPGSDADSHRRALALLGARHLGPAEWRPGQKVGQVVRLDASPAGHRPGSCGDVIDVEALAALPPLLRSYLAMGGWVSDHAVVDRQMNTLHVFTGLEIAAIPVARARALRAVAR